MKELRLKGSALLDYLLNRYKSGVFRLTSEEGFLVFEIRKLDVDVSMEVSLNDYYASGNQRGLVAQTILNIRDYARSI